MCSNTFRYRRALPEAILETAPSPAKSGRSAVPDKGRVHVSTRYRQPNSSESRTDDDQDSRMPPRR